MDSMMNANSGALVKRRRAFVNSDSMVFCFKNNEYEKRNSHRIRRTDYYEQATMNKLL